MAWGTVKLEPEVRDWLEGLSAARFARASVRVSYWIAPGRRIVLLTVFTRTRTREDREVDRARRALARRIEPEHLAPDPED